MRTFRVAPECALSMCILGRTTVHACGWINHVAFSILLYVLFTLVSTVAVGIDWCQINTGEQTITDGRGLPHNVYISVTRDGSVWLRAGRDRRAADWNYPNEHVRRVRTTFLSKDTIEMLQHLNYSDTCILTDVELTIRADGGWHPSYIVAFDPRRRTDRILLFNKKSMDCKMATNLSLTDDKQALSCDGGVHNVCGLKTLPERGQPTKRLFIKHVTLDPQGPEYWSCKTRDGSNSYSFSGSYYHIYVKLASCPIPTDSRFFGYEARLRARQDTDTYVMLIPDATQRALADGVIKGWQVYAKVISPEHHVYLQVWRPNPLTAHGFTLVGQSLFRPVELRFQEVGLSSAEYIRIRKGDVLGLYYRKKNPVAWSAVPCAALQQIVRYVRKPTYLNVGRTFNFLSASTSDASACRHYSFTAILANKTHKSVQDWQCPPMHHQLPKPDMRSENSGLGEFAHTRTTPKNSLIILERQREGGTGAIPIYLILIIIGCLLVMLILVGFISYYRAIKS